MLNNNNNNNENISEFNQLKYKYEEYINSLQSEVDFYKKEHEFMRQKIRQITTTSNIEKSKPQLAESNLLSPKNTLNTEEDVLQAYKKLTDAAISSLNAQISSLKSEKQTLYHLWKTTEKTAENLETEVTEYKKIWKQPNSMLEIRKEYESTVRSFQTHIKSLTLELKKQQSINKQLVESKTLALEQLATIERKFLEQSKQCERINQTQTLLNSAKINITEIMHDRIELEKKLQKSNLYLKEHMSRETIALNKIQEVLEIAEAAIDEKNKALQREKEIKDECDHLATTIGQVMDEAAAKVEQDMEQKEIKYIEKIKILENIIEKMKCSIEIQSRNASLAESKAQDLENKLKILHQNNTQLDSELHVASQEIIEMEIKMQAFEKLMTQEKEANRMYLSRAQELKEFLVQKKELKERWKKAVDEITNKLHTELKMLHEENANLKLENMSLTAKFRNMKNQENVILTTHSPSSAASML